jgi:UV DNA damage endonuclease
VRFTATHGPPDVNHALPLLSYWVRVGSSENHCHDPEAIPDREALELALATWPAGVTPKIHFSTPRTAVEERKRRVGRRVERRLVLPQLRAHADLIDPIAFAYFLEHTAGGHDFDELLEAKAKDLALLRLREQLAARR